jgi:hypothetical protein
MQSNIIFPDGLHGLEVSGNISLRFNHQFHKSTSAMTIFIAIRKIKLFHRTLENIT